MDKDSVDVLVSTPMSWDEYFMRHVYLAASMSKDPKTRIGAVIVRDGVIVSEGYNGFPRGVLDLKTRYDNRVLKRELIEHGEANAISNCARNGISTLGTKLYTQGIPCGKCAGKIIQSGIKEIVVHSQWPNLIHSQEWVDSVERSKMMLAEANVKIRYFNMHLNLVGFLDGKSVPV